jgi:hypothetical protein
MAEAAKSQGISGVGVAAAFAGGILIWAGIKGWSVSIIAQDLLSGKDPRTDPRNSTPANPVSPAGLITSLFGGILGAVLRVFGGGSGGGSSSGANVTAGPGLTSFAHAVLKGIGAPESSSNVQSIIAWAHREGGGGANNPLNTTLGMPGATNFNSVGVKNFTSPSQGATASVRTLLGGGYSDILSALRSGRGLCGSSYSGLSTWSGGGYSSVC